MTEPVLKQQLQAEEPLNTSSGTASEYKHTGEQENTRLPKAALEESEALEAAESLSDLTDGSLQTSLEVKRKASAQQSLDIQRLDTRPSLEEEQGPGSQAPEQQIAPDGSRQIILRGNSLLDHFMNLLALFLEKIESLIVDRGSENAEQATSLAEEIRENENPLQLESGTSLRRKKKKKRAASKSRLRFF